MEIKVNLYDGINTICPFVCSTCGSPTLFKRCPTCGDVTDDVVYYHYIIGSRGSGKKYYLRNLKKRRELMNIEVMHGRCYLVERDEHGNEVTKIDITNDFTVDEVIALAEV